MGKMVHLTHKWDHTTDVTFLFTCNSIQGWWQTLKFCSATVLGISKKAPGTAITNPHQGPQDPNKPTQGNCKTTNKANLRGKISLYKACVQKWSDLSSYELNTWGITSAIKVDLVIGLMLELLKSRCLPAMCFCCTHLTSLCNYRTTW